MTYKKNDSERLAMTVETVQIFPAIGDCVKPYGGTPGHPRVLVAYSLGVDFKTISMQSRRDRVVEMFQLLQTGINQALDEIESTFHMSREPVSKI